MAAIDGKILLKNNDCYKEYDKMTPKGIVVHSTGANNPNLRRYIAPDDGIIGKNEYGNDWNRPGEDVCVHAFIGKDKNGIVRTYQTLPFDICCWGCGGGSKGSYNYDPAYIQFEMCEDDLTSESYCKAVYEKAVALCAYLCKKYKLSVSNIVSHKEASERGYASSHGDPENWLPRFGYTMDRLRRDVRERLEPRTLDKKGFKKGDKGLGVLAFKQLLILAYGKGFVKTRVKNDDLYDEKTVKAVNELLKGFGYRESGTAGERLIKKLYRKLR